MNLTLTRKKFAADGVFGELVSDDGSFFAITLEHAYPQRKKYKSKIPPGEYKCVRGIHRLKDLVEFETFEVMGVPGCTGIIIHVGNYNEDSEGCILVGSAYGNRANGGQMITSSKQKFTEFMNMQKGVDEFILKVEAV